MHSRLSWPGPPFDTRSTRDGSRTTERNGAEVEGGPRTGDANAIRTGGAGEIETLGERVTKVVVVSPHRPRFPPSTLPPPPPPPITPRATVSYNVSRTYVNVLMT